MPTISSIAVTSDPGDDDPSGLLIDFQVELGEHVA